MTSYDEWLKAKTIIAKLLEESFPQVKDLPGKFKGENYPESFATTALARLAHEKLLVVSDDHIAWEKYPAAKAT